jgi:rod shape-determining protein MreC
MVRSSRAVGILETENANSFFVQFRTHEIVEIGDTLITSGLGGIYPKGIPVGYVVKVDMLKDPLFKRVYVRPSVKFGHLEEVFVVKLSPQWSAFRSELDSIRFEP